MEVLAQQHHSISHKPHGWPPIISARILDTVGRQLL